MAVSGLGISSATATRNVPLALEVMEYDAVQRIFVPTPKHEWSIKDHGVASKKYLEVILKTTGRRYEFGIEVARIRYRLNVQKKGARYVKRHS